MAHYWFGPKPTTKCESVKQQDAISKVEFNSANCVTKIARMSAAFMAGALVVAVIVVLRSRGEFVLHGED